MLVWRWRGVFRVTPQDWISPRKARRWWREEEAEHQPYSRISSPQVLRMCGSIITTTNPGLWPESPIQPSSVCTKKHRLALQDQAPAPCRSDLHEPGPHKSTAAWWLSPCRVPKPQKAGTTRCCLGPLVNKHTPVRALRVV